MLSLEFRYVLWLEKTTVASLLAALSLWSLPAALPAAQSAGIEATQRPILRFFAPQRRHVAPMRVKFGMLVPIFTSIGGTIRV